MPAVMLREYQFFSEKDSDDEEMQGEDVEPDEEMQGEDVDPDDEKQGV